MSVLKTGSVTFTVPSTAFTSVDITPLANALGWEVVVAPNATFSPKKYNNNETYNGITCMKLPQLWGDGEQAQQAYLFLGAVTANTSGAFYPYLLFNVTPETTGTVEWAWVGIGSSNSYGKYVSFVHNTSTDEFILSLQPNSAGIVYNILCMMQSNYGWVFFNWASISTTVTKLSSSGNVLLLAEKRFISSWGQAYNRLNDAVYIGHTILIPLLVGEPATSALIADFKLTNLLFNMISYANYPSNPTKLVDLESGKHAIQIGFGTSYNNASSIFYMYDEEE